jgi:hypothetical protein
MKPPSLPPGAVNLPLFAWFCWHQKPYHALHEILDGLMPISPYGFVPGVWDAVYEAVENATGIKGEQLPGRVVAAALFPDSYRDATLDDVVEACKKAMRRGDSASWGAAAKLAALARACELGPNAEAGAWAYSLVMLAKHSATGGGREAAPTGLPAPADEIALLIAGMDPETRLPLDEIDGEFAIAAFRGRTPAAMMLLSTVVSASVLSETFAVARIKKALAAIPNRNPQVISVMKAALEPAFKGLTIA